MNSFDMIPTSHNSQHPLASSVTTTTTNAPSQPLFDLQFAPEVNVTDNQQFHYLLQQQQQQRSPPQVMYDHRRDSISSSLGTPSRRGQSKAEKRAEHNAIERARREGLNTRFQQLAHVLPNLHHDTRPSKGTIIERTLDFVKDAIQKEERYRHEIKDLRHTNRQLLKQLTHLTTGQAAHSETVDSDNDEASIRSPSPVPGNTSPPLPITRGSSPSSISSGASSSHPESTQHISQPPQPRIRTKQKTQYQPQHPLPLNSTNQQRTPTLDASNQQQQQHQHQQQQRLYPSPPYSTHPGISKTSTAQRLQNTASLSSFASEAWQSSTTDALWPQQTASSIPSVIPFNLSNVSPSLAISASCTSIPSGLLEGYLFNDTTQTACSSSSSSTSSSSSVYPAPLQAHSGQFIHGAPDQQDIDMKPCDFNVLIKEEQHQPTFMPSAYPPTTRLSSRPSQSLSQYC